MTDNLTLPYATPRAFEAALTSRFKQMATKTSFTAGQLRRQFAYDRLLVRCFTRPDAHMWVLKGGISMLARLRIARHSTDVDLVATAETPSVALTALKTVAATDIGDFFTFDLAEPQQLVQGVEGIRVPITASLGPRLYESFHVDLVTAVTMTGELETAPAIADPGIQGLVRADYQIYPLADSVADKICAIVERHRGLPSTRFRDLVDLVLIARSRTLAAQALHIALASEHRRRSLTDTTTFDVPDRTLWTTGYTKAASRAPGIDGYQDLDAALALVQKLINPILASPQHSGLWDPTLGTWTT